MTIHSSLPAEEGFKAPLSQRAALELLTWVSKGSEGASPAKGSLVAQHSVLQMLQRKSTYSGDTTSCWPRSSQWEAKLWDPVEAWTVVKGLGDKQILSLVSSH